MSWAVGFCLGSIALLLGWLVAVVVIQLGAIRATEITDRSITLTNVAQGFLIAYEEEAERDYRPRIDDIVRDYWRAPEGRPRATPTRTYAGRGPLIRRRTPTKRSSEACPSC